MDLYTRGHFKEELPTSVPGNIYDGGQTLPAGAEYATFLSQTPMYPTATMPSGYPMTHSPPPMAAGGIPGSYPGVSAPRERMAQQDFPHFVHVPVFRTRKQIYVKKQAEGCCGCLNTSGYCDAPGGFVCFPHCNFAGCCDREMVLRVDRYGDPIIHKRRRQWRHPWEEPKP